MNTNRLPNASYKGIPFSWTSNTMDSGNKSTLHEYPNRDRGFVENLGKSIKQFTLQCEIYNTLDNDSIEEFEQALENGKATAGDLVLPLRGTIKDIQVLRYSTTEDLNKLGFIKYTVEFAQTSPNQYPTSTESNTGFLDRVKDRLLGENTEAFNNAWNTVKNKRTQTQKALQKVRETGRVLTSTAKSVEGASALLSDFANTISVLTNDTARLIQSPQTLAEQLKIGFESLENSVSNSRILFDIVGNYFNFSAGDDNAIGIGGIQKEVQENQNAINNLIKTNAIAIGYTISTIIDYENVQELTQFREKLKNAYDSLPENLDADVFASLEEIQVNANRILDRQTLTLPTLETITVNKQPFGVLMYSLYGNLDSYNDVYNINDFTDVKRVSGEILIIADA